MGNKEIVKTKAAVEARGDVKEGVKRKRDRLERLQKSPSDMKLFLEKSKQARAKSLSPKLP